MTQQQVDPEMIRELLAQLLMAQPSLNSDGQVEPYDLGYQKDVANFQQDQDDIFGDPMSRIMPGMFDPAAFQDVQTGVQEFELPSNPLQPYLALSDTSLEGFVARQVMAGRSPEEVAKAAMEAGYGNDTATVTRVRTLASDLFTGNYQFDQSMSAIPGMARDEQGAWQYQGDGQLQGNKIVVPEFGRSDAAKKFDERGLPTPDLKFGAADFGWGQEQATAASSERDAVAAMGAAAKAKKAAYESERNAEQARMNSYPSDAPFVPSSDSESKLAWDYVRGVAGGNRLRAEIADEGAAWLDRGAGGDRGGFSTRAALADWQQKRDAHRSAAATESTNFRQDRRARGYADEMARQYEGAGLTPLTMIKLQHAMQQRQMGA